MTIHYLSSVSPRPRTVSDDDILAATARAMSKVPPTRFTLADVAREVGLAPATLVQRFGSKRGLLLALASQSAASMDACFDAVRQAHASPLEALLDAATTMARFSKSPEELANSIAYLQIDLSDPDFHRHILESSRASHRGYRALLDEAVARGELEPMRYRAAGAHGGRDRGRLAHWVGDSSKREGRDVGPKGPRDAAAPYRT